MCKTQGLLFEYTPGSPMFLQVHLRLYWHKIPKIMKRAYRCIPKTLSSHSLKDQQRQHISPKEEKSTCPRKVPSRVTRAISYRKKMPKFYFLAVLLGISKGESKRRGWSCLESRDLIYLAPGKEAKVLVFSLKFLRALKRRD